MRTGIRCVWCGLLAIDGLTPGGLCDKCKDLTRLLPTK